MAARTSLAARFAYNGGTALPIRSHTASILSVTKRYLSGKVWRSAASRTEIVYRRLSGCPNLPLHGVVHPPVMVGDAWSHTILPYTFVKPSYPFRWHWGRTDSSTFSHVCPGS